MTPERGLRAIGRNLSEVKKVMWVMQAGKVKILKGVFVHAMSPRTCLGAVWPSLSEVNKVM